MPKLLLATTNEGKAREYRQLLEGVSYTLVTLTGENINTVMEEGDISMEENARSKAVFYAGSGSLVTLADDSGLEVDALGGEPGIRSARYAGEGASDSDRINYLLDRLEGIPWEKRAARFKCVIAIATPEGVLELCDGECRGIIALEPGGGNGFGYDPVFYLPELGKTMAEIPPELKNQISHRAIAAKKAHQILKQLEDKVKA